MELCHPSQAADHSDIVGRNQATVETSETPTAPTDAPTFVAQQKSPAQKYQKGSTKKLIEGMADESRRAGKPSEQALRGRIMNGPDTYRGSITREQWLVNETRTVARLMLDEGFTEEHELVDYVAANNPFQYPTEREVKSIARACARRLIALSNDGDIRKQLIDLIAHGTPDQLKQTNLYAMMRDNRIVWDFMLGVVARKFAALDTTLRKHEFVDFLEGLRAQDEKASRWSDNTMKKIRQVLAACLEQCGMYDRRTELLQPLFLDFELEMAIRANGDEQVLAAFGRNA